MNEIQMFSNDEFEMPLEFEQGHLLAYAAPIARGLGYRDAANLVRVLPEDCVVKRRPSETAGQSVPSFMRLGDQEDWYLTEEGFFRALGQRRTSMIPDKDLRARVERFQKWVFGEVLPSLRRHGDYSLDSLVSTWTLTEVTAQLRQRYGIAFGVVELTRTMRDAGILRQDGTPKAKYATWFWHTGSAWNLHAHMIRELAVKVTETHRAIRQAAQQLALHPDIERELDGPRP